MFVNKNLNAKSNKTIDFRYEKSIFFSAVTVFSSSPLSIKPKKAQLFFLFD